MTITVTDQFCGAGGSSLGATSAGAELRLALNHWRLAIETHNSNFPNADHDCTDVSACDPRRYPATDILITSPECTNHSLAKGKIRKWQQQLDMFGRLHLDPSEERSRATMWDVCRFAEAHNYKIVIVENVVEARHWAPFEAWLHAMRLLGYEHEIVYLNSQFAHPTPQSRDRMYVVFWKKTLRRPDLRITPSAHCPTCGHDVAAIQSWKHPSKRWGKYQQQYLYRCPECANQVTPYYYCAANAIDWSIPAPRIGDRRRPLKEKTLRRIRIGLEKFGRQVMLVDFVHSGHDPSKARSITQPWPTQIANVCHAMVAPPFLIDLAYTHGHDQRATNVADAMATQTGRQTQALVLPFLLSLNHSDLDRAQTLADPMPTMMPQGNPAICSPPIIVKLRGEESAQRIDQALGTVTAGGTHHGVLMPPAFLTSYNSTSTGSGMDETIPTQDTRHRHGLVIPPSFIVSYYTRLAGQQAAVRGLDDALPTVPGRATHYLAQASDTPEIEDCGFRMLQPHEIGVAMAFPSTYIVLGNQREKVRQYGNAVTPPVMAELVRRCLAVLGGEG